MTGFARGRGRAATALAAALVLAAAPAASAHPAYDYRGGCGFSMAPTHPRADPGTLWVGEVDIVVVALHAGDPAAPAPTALVEVACDLYVDGEYVTTLLATGGVGGAAAARTWVSDLDFENRLVELCERVTVAGELHDSCPIGHGPPLIPQPVSDLVDVVLDQLP